MPVAPNSRPARPREPLVTVRAARRVRRRVPHGLHGALLVTITPVLVMEVMLRILLRLPVIGPPERRSSSRLLPSEGRAPGEQAARERRSQG